MCPPATTPLLDISEHCSDEELFMSLEKFVCGGPLPMNVTSDVNPHHYKPENLPVGLWYFIVLQNHVAMEHGVWKAIGEPQRIFSNDSICGWRTTYIFRDQSSNNSTDDWLMQEYMITQNGIDDRTVGKDANLLCRVYGNCPSLIEQDLQLGPGLADTSLGTPGRSTNLRDLKSHTREGAASTSNRQADNIEVTMSVVRNNPPNQENVPDADWEVMWGDFLEIDDLLDIPPSPSSSSGNSSCLTMSSNECFDSLGLFQDIENEIIQDLKKKKVADHKFNVASIKPDRIVTCALSPGSFTTHIKEEIQTTRITIPSTSPPSSTTDIPASQSLPKQVIVQEKQNPGNNPLVCSRAMSASPSKTGKPAAAAAKWNKARGGTKMLKKLCFMPF